MITPDIIYKRTYKDVKKAEAEEFMKSRGIPSYVEVRLDSKKNISILDRHIRFIINPYLDSHYYK